MGTRDRRIGRVVAGAALGLTVIAVLAAAGCSKGPEPSTLETPNVVWPDGPPTGPYEDTEWVKAFRARELAEAVAWNAMDFSSNAFVEVVGRSDAADTAELRQSWHDRYSSTGDEQAATVAVMAGPDGSVILDLIPESDSRVTLVACVASRLRADGYQQAYIYRIESRGSGKYWVTVVSGGEFPPGSKSLEEYQAECEASTIPLGFFDPAPEPNLDPDAKVIGPADASKYDLD